MPKRIIDGEGLWRSDKLASIEPAWVKSEFANLLPLALANGTFECNPRLIWTRVYAFNRYEITVEQVEQILGELERVKLLFRWKDSAGKSWGFWVGIDKSGRLPSPSRQTRKHEAAGPELPAEQLRSFLETNGQPMPSHSVANGEVGFGFGSGSGLGIGSGFGSGIHAKPDPRQKGTFNSTEVATALCLAHGWSGTQMVLTLKDAIEYQSKQMPESSLEEVGDWLVAAWHRHKDGEGKFAGRVQTFFAEAKYAEFGEMGRSRSSTDILQDNPATRMRAQLEAD